jgi:hypothetical protein
MAMPRRTLATSGLQTKTFHSEGYPAYLVRDARYFASLN